MMAEQQLHSRSGCSQGQAEEEQSGVGSWGCWLETGNILRKAAATRKVMNEAEGRQQKERDVGAGSSR